jgi:hypothetical protein
MPVIVRLLLLFLCLLPALSVAAIGADASGPASLQEALGAPDWLRIGGETRMRLEALDGQFRPGRTRQDQLLLLRTLLHMEAGNGPLKLGLEFQDSRVYLDADDTPISNSYVNAADILQAYVALDADDLFGTGTRARLKIGRQTLSIGSKRQVQRVDFANVIKGYNAAYLRMDTTRGDEVHAFYGVRMGVLPGERDAVASNAHAFDTEEWGRRVFGLHYRRADILGAAAPGLWGEVYLYGLREKDTDSVATPNRRHVNLGARLYRKPAPGQWDMDVEGAWRTGSRHATSDPADTKPLDVNATMLFAAAGYTFRDRLKTRLALEYYVASGDDDPNDDTFGQYERLFNGRRGDLNNTSIHGPLTPANLQAPGFRIEISPSRRLDARVQYSAAFLASATDSFVIAKLRDRTGASGSFMGHTIDSRLRYWLVPDSLRLELGASLFLFGGFTKNVPDGPEGSRTLYGYGQLSFHF